MKTWQVWFAAAFLMAGIPGWMAPCNRFALSHPLSILGCLGLGGGLDAARARPRGWWWAAPCPAP